MSDIESMSSISIDSDESISSYIEEDINIKLYHILLLFIFLFSPIIISIILFLIFDDISYLFVGILFNIFCLLNIISDMIREN